MQIPTVDLDEERNRIILRFDYDRSLVAKVTAIPTARFKGIEKKPDEGDIYWYFKKDVDIARRIHDALDPEMSPAFRAWARDTITAHKELTLLSAGSTAKLEYLPEANPDLYQMIHVGPKGPHMTPEEFAEALKGDACFQAADVAFLAKVKAAILANHPGTGKTIEMIAAIIESRMEDKPTLVSAPRSSLYSVWAHWLGELQENAVYVIPDGRQSRIRMMQHVMDLYDEGEPFNLVVNPQMLTYNSDFNRCPDHQGVSANKNELRRCDVCTEFFYATYPEFEEIEWGTFIIDEFHMAGLGEPRTLTHRGAANIKWEKLFMASGTPMGGKPIKLFGPLNIMDPETFSSKWNFADMWLSVTESNGYKKIDSVRPEVEEEFYQMLSTRMIRRTKDEVLPWLPPKQIIDLTVPMTDKQRAQYEQFSDMAEVRIDEYKLSAVGVLAEYTRLKQFANAVQRVEVVPDPDPDMPDHLHLYPTEDSPKLPAIMELLGERGIMGSEDDSGDEQVVIFSESERMITMVHEYLVKHKIPAVKITGDVTTRQREKIQKDFQADGGPRVCCLTTTAGGVSITLDKASTAIFLDETWNPDDQEQALDRIHRASRIHQVVGYFIRTEGTIQQYIQDRVLDKSEINQRVLEFRKRGLFSDSREHVRAREDA